LLLVNPNQLFPAACIFSETIIRDPIKPRGKTRLAAKVPDVFVSTHKCFLGEIIGQSDISAGKLAKQTSHRRLVPADQLAKGVLIIIDKNSSDKVRIS